MIPMPKVAVIADICSSCTIVENLHGIGKISVWDGVLGGVKDFVWDAFGRKHCYKFVGDGWIILLPKDTDGPKLLADLGGLAARFNELYQQFVEPLHAHFPNGVAYPIGLTFGMDVGNVFRSYMIRRKEYFGPPINIASRLQGKLKDMVKPNPAGYMLVSDRCWRGYFQESTVLEWPAKPEVDLRNIPKADWYPPRLHHLR